MLRGGGRLLLLFGAFIFVGTLFELLGIQAVTVKGHPITLPAPLSDVNAAIALGTLSYLVILSGGIAGNGVKGVGRTLKEFDHKGGDHPGVYRFQSQKADPVDTVEHRIRRTLKEFSLPISMSFRLFGALLSRRAPRERPGRARSGPGSAPGPRPVPEFFSENASS